MITKRDIDVVIATETGVSQRKVSTVTAALISVVRRGLVQDGEVRLDGLGTMRTCVYYMAKGTVLNLTAGTGKKGQRRGTRKVKVPMQLRVQFSKATTLSKMLKDWYGGHNGQQR